jgi:Ran GTPase-activating protein (RanGAP) involved in mRNA processing and transport
MMASQPTCEELTMLDIESFDHKSIEKFADGLSCCQSLKHVQINNCNIDGIIMSSLVKGFKTCNLTCLNLSDNQLTDDSMEAINSLLAWHYAQRDSEK